MAGKMMERRKITRYPLSVPVLFTWRGKSGPLHRGEGMTRDISASGAYVLSVASPPLRAVLKVEFTLPRPSGKGRTRIKGKLVVLRVDGNAKVGKRIGFAGAASHVWFPATAPS
jgi:hypothetical protein